MLGVHSITSSARASSNGGTVMPSALAVLRLITSSNFIGVKGEKPADLPVQARSKGVLNRLASAGASFRDAHRACAALLREHARVHG